MRKEKNRNGTEADPLVRELQLIRKNGNSTNELLQDLLITRLGMAGVPQLIIRKIVGVGIDRVNRVVKHLKNIKNQIP